MKQTIFSILVAAGFLTGCTSAYKSSQTPDDVYYSPAKYVVAKELNTTKDQREYQEYISSNDDRYLQMKVHNYDYWNSLDDYSYWNDSRYYYYNSFYNPYYSSFYNPYGWGGYYSGFGYGYGFGYNPYYFGYNPFYDYYGGYGGYGGGWYNPAFVVNSYKDPTLNIGTAGSNIFAYQNRIYNNSNNSPFYNFRPGTIAGTSTNNFGTLVRRVFSSPANNSNNNYSNSWSNPVRMQSSSSYSSSSAGGNSGGYSSKGSSSSGGRAPRN
ncbi:hypothetical protein GALL_57080 [mine drainage metagenome]|uniref:Vitellogenin II n=1 Tax=mine drainage metagenome TaxID=410659 RepID=A0A1J5SZF6_9ZZZZ